MDLSIYYNESILLIIKERFLYYIYRNLELNSPIISMLVAVLFLTLNVLLYTRRASVRKVQLQLNNNQSLLSVDRMFLMGPPVCRTYL